MVRRNGMELIRGMKTREQAAPSEARGLAGWVLKMMKNRSYLREVAERQMRLEETLSLGGKRQLLLVSCAGERFLVGGSMESIEVIVPVRSASLPEAAGDVDTQCR